jgi:hypothetical protein
MNKIITIIFVLLIGYCEAATGNASDGPLSVIVIIGLVLLIAGIGYFIDLMKIKLKEYRSRRLIKRNNFDQNDEFLNVFNNPIPETEGVSSY